jgi:WD40 repeat protein
VRRAADTDLVAHLLEGLFCYVLTSRQMGKSSLMVQTAKKLREAGTKVAVLDLQRIGQNLTPEQWYDGLLIPLGREFGLADELDDYWNSADPAIEKMGPMHRWMTAIREVILRSVKSRIVIFVDEIDAVRGLPFSTDEFFAGIRQMYNERTLDPELERITFCLLGVATPSDLIRNVNTTPFNIGHRVELSDFTEEEAQPLLAGLGRDEAVGHRLLSRVLWWTGGHPYLTQRLCARVALDETVRTGSDVDRVCTDTFLSSRAKEKDDNLLFVRERLLRSEVDRASIPDDETSTLVDVLRLAGIVTVSGHRLSVRNRIYARVFDKQWIRINMPDAELRRQKRAFYQGLTVAATIALLVLGVIGYQYIALRKTNSVLSDRIAIVYGVNSVQVQQDFDIGDFGAGTTLLDQMAQNAADRDHHNAFSWKWLWSRAGGESASTYNGHWDEVRSGDISPDGQLIATGGADSTVRILQRHKTCPAAQSPPQPGAPVDQSSIPCFQLLRALVVDKTGITSYLPEDPAWKDYQRNTKPADLPSVASLHFSPDGKWLAIATGYWRSTKVPGHVYLWRTSDGTVIKEPLPTRHEGTINALAFGGGWLATAGMDKTGVDNTTEFFRINPDGSAREDRSKEYRPASGAMTGAVYAVAFSPTGRYYAMAFEDGHLAVKDMDAGGNGAALQLLDVSGLTAVTFYSDQIVLLGSKDGDIWQIDSGLKRPKVKLVNAGQRLLTCLTVSHDPTHDPKRDLLISTGSDSTVGVWQLKLHEGRIEAWDPLILRGHRGKVDWAAVSKDQQLIVSGSADATVRIWARQPNVDFRDPSSTANTANHSAAGGDSTSPNGFPSLSPDTPNYASHSDGIGVQGVVSAVAFSPQDGSQLVFIRGVPNDEKNTGPHGDRTEVFFYNFATRDLQVRWAKGGYGTEAAYSPDGELVATGADDGSVMLWDTAQARNDPAYAPIVLRGGDSANPITGLSFSKDGTLAATNGYGGSILLWKPNRGSATGADAYQQVDPVPSAGYRGPLAFSPDGKWLAVCTSGVSGNTVEVLDGDHPGPLPRMTLKGDEPDATGDHIYHSLQGRCSAVAFSRDTRGKKGGGLWLAAGTSSREIDVWNVSDNGDWRRITGYYYSSDTTGREEKAATAGPPEPAARINTITFVSGVAYGTTDSNIGLWSITDQQPRPSFAVHSGGVTSISFSPNYQCMASGSTDGTVRITPTADAVAADKMLDPTDMPEWTHFGDSWLSCVGHAATP